MILRLKNKMTTISIKAISVNNCWRGRRFKTQEYKDYEQELLLLLPKIDVPEGELLLEVEVGFSSVRSDLDNIAKPFIDILQKKYHFNDRWITEIRMVKIKVKKKEEYIKFKLTSR